MHRIEGILYGQSHTGAGEPGKEGISQFLPQIKAGNNPLEVLGLLLQLPDVTGEPLLRGFLGQILPGDGLRQSRMVQILRIQTVLCCQLPQGGIQSFQNGLVSALLLHPGAYDLLQLGIVFGILQNLLPGEPVLGIRVSGGLTFGGRSFLGCFPLRLCFADLLFGNAQFPQTLPGGGSLFARDSALLSKQLQGLPMVSVHHSLTSIGCLPLKGRRILVYQAGNPD